MIQPKSEMISIIPQPRGNRAFLAICSITVVCLIGLFFIGPENHTRSQIAYVLAIHFILSQSWQLVVCFCEFWEEIAHVKTRYNGEYLRAAKASICMRSTCVLFLTAAICYMFYDKDMWEKIPSKFNLFMLFLCNLLGCLSGLQDPTPAAVSRIMEQKQLNVAHGLAWSYYVGYLKFVLPALKDSVERYNAENENKLKSSDTHKLHILIPLSCKTYGDLKEIDKNITFEKEIPPLYIDRAGIKGRVFKNNVYRILDEKGRPYYRIVEYATPLESLLEMSNDTNAAFSKEDRYEQAKLFCRTLMDILENSKECRNAFRLVIYDDCPKGEDYSEKPLSREILKQNEECDINIREYQRIKQLTTY